MPVATAFAKCTPRETTAEARVTTPRPPLSKGGKDYAARSGSFQEGTVAEARVTTPPCPPLASGAKALASPFFDSRNGITRSAIANSASSTPAFHQPSMTSLTSLLTFSPNGAMLRKTAIIDVTICQKCAIAQSAPNSSGARHGREINDWISTTATPGSQSRP